MGQAEMEAFEKIPVQEKIVCDHCGLPCEDKEITSGNNIFCCIGCKTVFEILHENGLEDYYSIESNPGISFRQKTKDSYFNFLDNKDIRRRILNFESPHLAKIKLYIPSIHCSSCIWLLENLYRLREGVSKSEVNFPRKEVFIDFDPSVISLRELVELLASLGYEPEIYLENSGRNRVSETSYRRSLIVKIGIAGFCFGNIMLLSFPEYLGLDKLLENDFGKFFSYVNILFSLPVLLYSASGYYLSAFKGLRHRTISIDVPITIGIMTLFFRSLYEVFSQTGPGYFDSLSGLVFFLLIGKWFQNRTYASLLFDRNYRSYFPVAVTKLENGRRETIQIEDLREGDTIRIRNGELIPADAELLSLEARIDNSFVTGESDLVHFKKGEYVYAGGRQAGPAIELKVKKEVSQSYLTQLWNNEAFHKDHISKRVLVDKISEYFTWIILGIAVAAAIFWWFNDPSRVFNVFTAVLIVACPCALALSTPFAVGTAMRILGRNGCYLKNGDVIEGISHIDHIVFDKTGTISQSKNRMIHFKGELGHKEALAALAVVENSYHPLSRRIQDYLSTEFETTQIPDVTDFQEVTGKGLEARAAGIRIRLGSLNFVDAGQRIDAFPAGSRVYLSLDDHIRGFFEIPGVYRPGFESVVKQLGSLWDLSLLSGDNDSEKEYLHSVFPAGTVLKFQQSAFDKVKYIKRLRTRGAKTVMIGDGLNDSGALAEADIGVAIAEDVNNFTPASDMILSGIQFDKLPKIVRFSSSTLGVIVASFIISFLYNIVGISFAVSGKLTPVFAAILMPLSSISVVLFTTVLVKGIGARLGFD